MEPRLILVDPWIEPHSPEDLEVELGRELSPSHPLFAKEVRALALASDRDDVLFRFATGNAIRYAVVHLTWSGAIESNPYPLTRVFDSLDAWRNHQGKA